MKEFIYTITDENGIHARPAGLLVKKASEFESEITIRLDKKSVDAKKIFSVMSLGAKNGDTVSVSVSGSDEEKATKELSEFLKTNL